MRKRNVCHMNRGQLLCLPLKKYALLKNKKYDIPEPRDIVISYYNKFVYITTLGKVYAIADDYPEGFYLDPEYYVNIVKIIRYERYWIAKNTDGQILISMIKSCRTTPLTFEPDTIKFISCLPFTFHDLMKDVFSDSFLVVHNNVVFRINIDDCIQSYGSNCITISSRRDNHTQSKIIEILNAGPFARVIRNSVVNALGEIFNFTKTGIKKYKTNGLIIMDVYVADDTCFIITTNNKIYSVDSMSTISEILLPRNVKPAYFVYFRISYFDATFMFVSKAHQPYTYNVKTNKLTNHRRELRKADY